MNFEYVYSYVVACSSTCCIVRCKGSLSWNQVVFALVATFTIAGIVAGLIYYGVRQRRRAQLRRLLMSLRGEDEGEDVFGEADRSHAAGGELGAFSEHDPADLRAARTPATNAGFNFAPSPNFGIGSAAARLGLNFSPRLGFRSGLFAGGGSNAGSRPLSVRESEQTRLLDEQSAEPDDDLIFGTRTRASAANEQHVTMEALNREQGAGSATTTNPRARLANEADEFGEYRSDPQPSRFGVWGRMFGVGNNRNARAPQSQVQQNKSNAQPDDLLLDDHNVDSVATAALSASASRAPNPSTTTTSSQRPQQQDTPAAAAKAPESGVAASGPTASSNKPQPSSARTQNKGLFLPARLQNVTELDEDDEPILELGAGLK